METGKYLKYSLPVSKEKRFKMKNHINLRNVASCWLYFENAKGIYLKKNKMMETGKYLKYSLPVSKGKRFKMKKPFFR